MSEGGEEDDLADGLTGSAKGPVKEDGEDEIEGPEEQIREGAEGQEDGAGVEGEDEGEDGEEVEVGEEEEDGDNREVPGGINVDLDDEPGESMYILLCYCVY